MRDNLFTKLAMVLLTVTLAATFSWAEQDTQSGEKKWHGKRGKGPGGMKNLIAKLNKAVQPTAEQEPQLDQIWKTHRQSMKNWRKEHGKELKAARKKIVEAKKSGDKEAIEAAKKEIKAIRDSRSKLMKNLKQQLSGVLTKEQMEKAKPILAKMSRGHKGKGSRGPMGALKKLDLTEEQKAKIKEIMKDSAAQCNKTDDKKVKRQIRADAFKKIKQNVLTDEQRKKLKSMWKPRGEMKARHKQFQEELNLTDEQKAKAKEIMGQARKDAEKAEDRKAKQRILAAARKKVRQEVWTEEQRTQAKEKMAQRHEERMKKMGLSEEQIAQVKKIMGEARKKAKKVDDPQEKRKIMRAAFKKVREEVWTDEQREKFGKGRRMRGRKKRHHKEESE